MIRHVIPADTLEAEGSDAIDIPEHAARKYFTWSRFDVFWHKHMSDPSGAPANKIVCVFDANSLYARSFYAAQNNQDPLFTGGAGAALIAARSVLSILNPLSKYGLPERPTHLCFCWDGRAKRDKGRAPKPQAYVDGRETTKQLLTVMLGAAHAFPEFEADDAAATLVHRAHVDQDVSRAYVVSGDKDLLQVITRKVGYYSLNEKCVLPISSVLAKWKVKHPSQIAIALAILGDPGDMVCGIKGWGIKKVEKIFQNITADMPLAQIADQVCSTMTPEQFRDFADSLELTLLARDVPNLPEPAPIQWVNSLDELAELGFPTLAPTVDALKLQYTGSSANLQELPDFDV